jgi:putative mRNA 3-end processing factor
MADDAEFTFVEYGQTVKQGGVEISLHPAGHILGSSQIRLECRGRVEVVSGDYKLQSDPTCSPWMPLRCHRFVTESTFGLPIYRWPDPKETFDSINAWWRASQLEGKVCLLYGYAVGKSQRLLAGLDPSIGPIFTHGAVEKACEAYRRSGISLPRTHHVGSVTKGFDWNGALVVAVPSAHGSPWTRRFGRVSTAMASGWMAVRGSRRRRNIDRGFVLSDHVDWPALLEAVSQCQPESVWVGHGYAAVVARYLSEQGLDAQAIAPSGRREAEEDGAEYQE